MNTELKIPLENTALRYYCHNYVDADLSKLPDWQKDLARKRVRELAKADLSLEDNIEFINFCIAYHESKCQHLAAYTEQLLNQLK